MFWAVVLASFFYFKPTPPVKEPVNPVAKNIDSVKTYQSLDFQFQYEKNLIAKEDSEEEFNQRGNGTFRKNFTGYVGYEPGKFLRAVVVLDNENDFETNLKAEKEIGLVLKKLESQEEKISKLFERLEK